MEAVVVDAKPLEHFIVAALMAVSPLLVLQHVPIS